MTTPILACTDLTKRYGSRTAISGLSFVVNAGEAYGLLGPNGAGKTTTISLVCGLFDADEGTVSVCGERITPRTLAPRSAIGYVPQDVALYPGLSARDNLIVFGRLYGLKGKTLRSRVDEALALVGLIDRADDKVREYSGGMKRRANIAAALLHEPRLLVLDEPTVGVDPQSRNAILDRVSQLKAEGVAVLFASHDFDEVERMCERVGILDEGKLVVEGPPLGLIREVGSGSRLELRTTGSLQALADVCLAVRGVQDVGILGTTVQVVYRGDGRVLADVTSAAAQAECPLEAVEISHPSLEDVFLQLTGKALRD
jgi:linearmycin/streptolysin S transport system ATP-binding protein